MERGLTLLVAALVVYVTPSVQGTAHLSSSNATVDITRSGCGVNKLCVETPDDCDPAGTGSCLFVSVVATAPVAPNGTMLSIELRGDSSGYIALGLTADPSEGTTMLFICAQNSLSNGSFFFRTMTMNNTDATLSANEELVSDIRGMVTGTVIKCEFNITSVNATNSRSSPVTTFSILLGSGPTNGTTIGPFNRTLTSGPLNLADPASNAVNTTAAPAVNATAAPAVSTTMPNSGGAVQPHGKQNTAVYRFAL
ncbi:putative ferric-chelate reductase 1 [Anarrhichthys ocellatus]|uniref:putative ferric-chelate reductase 1 n=1 Tax=Anarrhichthys ocellatus TaxID=433405 RepID=UPI0012ECD43A|nr:putative ferric-chelate reductase 1 [Anarrhichthys ocellatus]